MRALALAHVHACSSALLTYASPLQEAARPKTLKREEWMLVPPSSSDLLSSALLFPSSFTSSPHIDPGLPLFTCSSFSDTVVMLNYSFIYFVQRSIQPS